MNEPATTSEDRGSLLHSPMDEEERDHFFISSFFMASFDIAKLPHAVLTILAAAPR